MPEIALTEIRTDGGTQMRAELREEVCEDYRDLWIAGVKFQEVDVFHDGSAYWLADGFHRYFGALKAKRETIPAKVHKGTLRDAILHATKANSEHGLRRSNADKRKAVETLLNDEEWCKWSDGKIADQAGVSQRFVSEVRNELRTVLSSAVAKTADQPRVGRDGKSRKPPQPASNGYAEALDRIRKVNGKAAADLMSGTLQATKQQVVAIGELPESEIGPALLALRNGEAQAEPETNGNGKPRRREPESLTFLKAGEKALGALPGHVENAARQISDKRKGPILTGLDKAAKAVHEGIQKLKGLCK